MPVKSRGTLLAGMAALLGLYTAGAGCQSSAVRPTACATGNCEPAASAGVSLPGVAWKTSPASTTTKRRPLFDFGRPKKDEPALAKGCEACGTPAATMLRPVPAGQPGGAVASAWAPIERGGAAPLAAQAGGPQLIPTSSVGMPVGTQDTPAVAPIPVITGSIQQPDDRSKDMPGQQLPAPRILKPRNGGAGAQGGGPAAGYPDLPAPLVPHPPEVPREHEKRALSSYIIEPPDILLIRATSAVSFKTMPIDGSHLVRPDGTVNLGAYGEVFVAGLTTEQAALAVARLLSTRVWKTAPNPRTGEKGERWTPEEIRRELLLDVVAYNSKFYYVITDGAGYGEQVIRIPITGNETVLDALAQIQGLPAQSSKKKIWVARSTPNHSLPIILPVDWCAITQRGSAGTNYQVFPGDRIYVHSDPLLRLDTRITRIVAPIERLFGVTLLGASTVNAIKGTSTGTGGAGTIR